MTYMVAWLSPGENASSFTRSCQRLLQWDFTHDQQLRGFIHEECGSGRIIDGRNQAVRKFLASDSDWLVFIDADMGFDPWAVDQLIAVGDPDERPIVGGLCFGSWRGPPGPAGSRRQAAKPTIYRYFETSETCGVYPVNDYPRNALVRCHATGSAFIAIHRSVYEAMAEDPVNPLRPWYDEDYHKGQIFSEDLTFCLRAGAAGFPTHVHTAIKTSHYKQTYLEESMVDTSRDMWVVVPVKGRNDLTGRLLEGLDGDYTGVLLLDNGSTAEERAELDELAAAVPRVEVLDAEGLNIHQMWNVGIEIATARSFPTNVAILNNDLEPAPGMLSTLAAAMEDDPTLGVVCPNYDDRAGFGVEYVDDMCAGRYDGTGGLAGFAFVIRGESNYRFPEELGWWYGDNDLLLSVRSAGMNAGIVLHTTATHVDGGSQTGEWDTPEMRAQLAADSKAFQARWPQVQLQPAGG